MCTEKRPCRDIERRQISIYCLSHCLYYCHDITHRLIQLTYFSSNSLPVPTSPRLCNGSKLRKSCSNDFLPLKVKLLTFLSLLYLPHPIYRPTQTSFPYEWLVLAQASQLPNPFKQATAGLNEPPALIPLFKWPQAWD